MAHATTPAYYSLEETLHEIKAGRSRRSWMALTLFALSALAAVTGLYLSYRDLPTRPTPANDAGLILTPDH